MFEFDPAERLGEYVCRHLVGLEVGDVHESSSSDVSIVVVLDVNVFSSRVVESVVEYHGNGTLVVFVDCCWRFLLVISFHLAAGNRVEYL